MMRLILPGEPRTAKNSPQLVMGRAVLLPSPHYRTWAKEQLRLKGEFKAVLGDRIPLRGPVSLKAIVYRSRNVGDYFGYLQGIADILQSSNWKCLKCRRKTVLDVAPERCRHCNHPAPKAGRRGLGIYLDDKQVVHVDGSRLEIDKQDPRVEVTIEELDRTLFSEGVDGADPSSPDGADD